MRQSTLLLAEHPARISAKPDFARDLLAIEATSPSSLLAYGDHESRDGLLIAFGGNNTAGPIEVATARSAHSVPSGRLDFESETFICFDSRQDPNINGSVAGALGTAHPQAQAVAFNLRGRDGGSQAEIADKASLRSSSGGSSRSYIASSGVRRLTPLECERLMGLPDHWTAVPVTRQTKRGTVPKWRRIAEDEAAYYAAHGLPVEWHEGMRQGWRTSIAADGPRYAAIGNSMIVPELRWIGERIEMVEALMAARQVAA